MIASLPHPSARHLFAIFLLLTALAAPSPAWAAHQSSRFSSAICGMEIVE